MIDDDMIFEESLSARRAWIEIVIDPLIFNVQPRSLSARRAWIEMPTPCAALCRTCVALRKESVDRNNDTTKKKKINPASLSARRAWIEISITSEVSERVPRRSPQGERG